MVQLHQRHEQTFQSFFQESEIKKSKENKVKCPPDQIYITNTGYNLLSLNINLCLQKNHPCHSAQSRKGKSQNLKTKNINLFDWEKDLSRLWVKDLEDVPLNKLSKFWDQPGFPPPSVLSPMREALNKL